jgi:hypothetical protein
MTPTERRWTIYGCKHVRRGDFGPREWALEPPVNSCSACEEIEVVPATQLAGAVEERREFVEGLTRALSDHGVPAMPSWREAIDWLAANGGQ